MCGLTYNILKHYFMYVITENAINLRLNMVFPCFIYPVSDFFKHSVQPYVFEVTIVIACSHWSRKNIST